MPKTTRAPRRRRTLPEPEQIAVPVTRLAQLPARYGPVREQVAVNLARGQQVWSIHVDGRPSHLLVANPGAPAPAGAS